jgi:hypothetical protein
VATYLVCEGSRLQLDERILDELVIKAQNSTVLVVATGGKKGHGAIRAYLESQRTINQRTPNVAVSVEDRDYGPATGAQSTWANHAGKRFIWRRHEIENYLLHSRVVLELFNDFRAASAAWANSLPATEADVSALLRTLASPLLEDYVAEVLREEIVQQINAIGSLSFGPQRPNPAAGLPVPGQAQWLPALQQEAIRLGGICTAVATHADLSSAAIASRYSALLSTIQNPAFLGSDSYLNDMGGKELLDALSRHLRSLGAPGAAVNRDVLADGLLRVLAPIYQPNTIYQPDDFAELAAILRQS